MDHSLIKGIKQGIKVANPKIGEMTAVMIEYLAAAWTSETGLKASESEICIDPVSGFRGVRITVRQVKK